MINLAIMKTKIIILVIVGTIICYQYWQINELRNDVIILSQNNRKLKSAIEIQKQTMDSLETGLSDAIENSIALAEELVVADEQRQVITEELNSYRGRLENAALKKPTLVESRVNGAFVDVLRQFDEATNSKD